QTTVNGTVNVSTQVVVVTSAGEQMATEWSSTSVPLGSFSDAAANANSWQVDVNWGDNTAHTTFTVNSQGALPNTPHTYGEEGSYTVTVTVTDNANASGSVTFQVTVSDPAVVASAVNFTAAPSPTFKNKAVATCTHPGVLL